MRWFFPPVFNSKACSYLNVSVSQGANFNWYQLFFCSLEGGIWDKNTHGGQDFKQYGVTPGA